jgi:hypothetical protein
MVQADVVMDAAMEQDACLLVDEFSRLLLQDPAGQHLLNPSLLARCKLLKGLQETDGATRARPPAQLPPAGILSWHDAVQSDFADEGQQPAGQLVKWIVLRSPALPTFQSALSNVKHPMTCA